ncbi:hypothetical protein [Streptomyces sp. SJL17-4]|uniref:hypothetical protein n=1 Tax=Streptomyces sp. SJL17-4 TaxID=2967224 RepID=UPI0030CE1925
MPKPDRTVLATTSATSTVSVAYAASAVSVAYATRSATRSSAGLAVLSGAGQDAGPAPSAARRPPLRELPRGGRRGAPAAAARNRYQAPRRTY